MNPSPTKVHSVFQGKSLVGTNFLKNVICFHFGDILLPLGFYFHFCFRKFRIVSSLPGPGVCGFRPGSLQVGEAPWNCPHSSPTVTQ